MPPRRQPRKPAVIVLARRPRQPRGAAHRRPAPARRARAQVARSTVAVPRRIATRSSGAMRSLPNNTKSSMPLSFSSTTHPRFGSALRVTGVDHVGSVKVPAGETVGTVYYQTMNSATPLNTRLSSFAALFSRWFPIKYRYVFRPSVAEGTTPGTYIMAQDPDPLSSYVTAEPDNVPRLRALPGASMRQAWQSNACDLAPHQDYTSLWCFDPDVAGLSDGDRLDLAGRFVMACAAPTGLDTGTVLGTLELEYVVDFMSTRMGSSVTTRESVMATATESTLGSTIRESLAEGKTFVDTVITTLRSAVTLASEVVIEPIADPLRRYVALTYNESEVKEAKGPRKFTVSPASAPAGFPPGKYNFSIYAWSATSPITIDSIAPSLFYSSGTSDVTYIDGPSIRAEGKSAALTALPLEIGAVIPGGPTTGLVHTGALFSYSVGFRTGCENAFADFSYPDSLSIFPANVQFTVVLGIAAATSGTHVGAGAARAVPRPRAPPPHSSTPAAAARTPVIEFDFDEPSPVARRNVHPPGMAIPVPGTADYTPRAKVPSKK